MRRFVSLKQLTVEEQLATLDGVAQYLTAEQYADYYAAIMAEATAATAVTTESTPIPEAPIIDATAAPQIVEIPGGGGAYDTQTGTITYYDPIASEPFQQPGQVYPTIQESMVVPEGPWVVDGEVYTSFEAATAAAAFTGLLKSLGQTVSATVLFSVAFAQVNAEADIDLTLALGTTHGSTRVRVKAGTHQVTISVPAQYVGTYSAQITLSWKGEVLAQAVADRQVKVQ